MIHFTRVGVLAANWASLLFAQLKLAIVPQDVFFGLPWHKPVAMQTDQVEAMEALLQRHQVRTICEFLRVVLTKLVEADVATSFDGVVVRRD